MTAARTTLGLNGWVGLQSRLGEGEKGVRRGLVRMWGGDGSVFMTGACLLFVG